MSPPSPAAGSPPSPCAFQEASGRALHGVGLRPRCRPQSSSAISRRRQPGIFGIHAATRTFVPDAPGATGSNLLGSRRQLPALPERPILARPVGAAAMRKPCLPLEDAPFLSYVRRVQHIAWHEVMRRGRNAVTSAGRAGIVERERRADAAGGTGRGGGAGSPPRRGRPSSAAAPGCGVGRAGGRAARSAVAAGPDHPQDAAAGRAYRPG